MIPLTNFYLYSAVIYVVIAMIYVRRTHGRGSRLILAGAALALAMIALLRSGLVGGIEPESADTAPVIALSVVKSLDC